MAIAIENLSPVDMSEIGRTDTITFDIVDPTPLTLIAGWVKYQGRIERILIFDGVNFVAPFNSLSSLEDVNSDQTRQRFIIAPVGGWESDLEALTFRSADGTVDIT